ncbi:MAG: hypothetical protein WBW73_10310 [Rhodoplanes sp.]
MKKETRSAVMQLRVRPSIKKAAEEAAAADNRSLTSLVEKLLTDYLRQHAAHSKTPDDRK